MSRHNPNKINSTHLCDYGCNNIAKYQFKSGKLCCSDAIQKCPEHIRRQIETRKKDVDPVTGLNAMQRGQAKATQIKKETGAFPQIGKKISATKNQKLANGLRRCDISFQKMIETKKIVGEDGLTNSQRAAKRRAQKRINDIDETGLNQYQRWTKARVENGVFDRGFEKAKQILHDVDTGIRYQGSYELKFIEEQKKVNGIEWVKLNVKRGPSVQYVDYYGATRWYLSDFLIGDTVYEIKSGWTWNKNGRDTVTEYNNLSKLNAALAAGYNVKLLINGKEIEFKKTG